MLQFLSLVISLVVIAIAVGAVVVTAKEEMPFILRALGISPSPFPRVRIQFKRPILTLVK